MKEKTPPLQEGLEELLKQNLTAMDRLSKQVEQIAKALTYKADKAKKKEKPLSIEEQIKMNLILKSRHNKNIC